MTLHTIKAGAGTVLRGIIDPAAPPIRIVQSGDHIAFDTWTMWDNASAPTLTLDTALSLRERCRAEQRGPHTLTGPIGVAGAKPGQVLKVDIERLEVADHGINLIFAGEQSRGVLAYAFPEAELRHFELDRRTMTTRLGENVVIPLRPFLGIMGVLPPGSSPVSSSVPGAFGGNIDCSDLVVGTTLYLPIFVEGAGFYAGDAHAAQGCGEVSQTALETAMTDARLRLTLLDREAIPRPRAETPHHFITMGFDVDLGVAARQATADMIDLLAETHGMSRGDAYALCSLQADLLITQAVNGVGGVHARIPKGIFRSQRAGGSR